MRLVLSVAALCLVGCASSAPTRVTPPPPPTATVAEAPPKPLTASEQIRQWNRQRAVSTDEKERAELGSNIVEFFGFERLAMRLERSSLSEEDFLARMYASLASEQQLLDDRRALELLLKDTPAALAAMEESEGDGFQRLEDRAALVGRIRKAMFGSTGSDEPSPDPQE